MQSYAIMHLDRRVATLRGNGSCTIYFKSFMPYSLYLEPFDDLDTRLNNLNNFYHWCASRVLTLDRVYAKEILNSLGKKQAVTDKDRAEIAISYHALTLTDVYWVRPLGESLRYADISLFDHSLSDAFVDVSLRGKPLTIQNAALLSPSDVTGDLSTQGVAPKAWVRRNGEFWLYKDGSRAEVDAELLASKIARCFRVPQVLYEKQDYQGEPVSASRLITSKAFSLVNMEYIEVYAASHDTDAHTLVLHRDAYGYHMMNIIDYLIGNTDRHWGNWGFFVDNQTNRLKKLYPLMDFNQAFHAYDTLEGSRCQTTPMLTSQMDAAKIGVQKVGLNQIAPVRDEWFSDKSILEMFKKRLSLLQNL